MNESTDTIGKLVTPWQYVTKITIYHVVTYIVCGIIFSSLFNYSELFNEGCMAYYMQPIASTNTLMGPLFQVVRGLMFGLNSTELKYAAAATSAAIVALAVRNARRSTTSATSA